MKPTRILLAGEGGQGVQTIAKIIIDTAAKEGRTVSAIASFGVEQRGTPSISFVSLSNQEIRYPRFDLADYAIILQRRAVAKIERYISPKTKVIFDSSTVDKDELPSRAVHVYGLPATRYAYEKFIPKSFNLIIAGKLSQILNLPIETAWETIEAKLGKKMTDQKIRQANKEAFEFGYQLILEMQNFSEPVFAPSTHTVFERGFGKKAEVMASRCKGCGLCIEKCPVRALKFGETLGVFATPVPEIDLEKCIACGNCWRFCPDSAINVIADKKTKRAES